MKTAVCSFALAILSALPHNARAADYEGADAILKQIAAHHDAEIAKPATKSADAVAGFEADLQAFRKTAPMLSPDEAAKGWLDLADRYSGVLKQATSARNFGSRREIPTFEQVIAALPPPAAWKAIVKSVEARPTDGKTTEAYHAILLRLITHRLVDNRAALNKDIEALHAFLQKTKAADNGAEALNSFINGLKGMLLEDADNGDEILKRLNQTLIMMASPASQRGGNQVLSVPDLVTLVGKEKATDFLRRALLSKVQLRIDMGDETIKLARSLALKMVADLKAPQWSLVKSIDATALYEAMEKRFPDRGRSDGSDYTEARSYYLLGLIAAHRTKEASALAAALRTTRSDSLPYSGLDALERAGFTNELADFFYDLLTKNPDAPFWSNYVDLAVKAGQEKKMVALAETAAARTGLNEKQRGKIQGYLAHAYLATDRVDEGVAILRKQIADAKKAPADDKARDTDPEESVDVGELGIDLAELGAVLERKDLIDEGIQTARDALKAKTEGGDEDRWYPLARLLIKLDRGQEAEAVVKDALLALPANDNSTSMAQRYLVLLMDIYHRANRPADVLALLDGSPQWGKKDVSELLTQSVEIDRNSDYAGYFVADALAASGRNPEAVKILNALLDAESDYDPAYELLIKIAPREEVLARMDVLFSRDKFEPRPLFWKAKLLLDAGKAEEAEKAARQAVAIDPSDGEHGPGRRMRVYSVLADIRQARGDAKEAEFFRGVVTSIRHSENADRFYETGLITRAIKMYEESLTHFADAYCIQSRLAVRMAEVGDMAGAEEHYRRAYELMPDSFGRVESHCFGCEGAFSGYYAQSIAEKVFTDLAKKRPDKPQVHYLLGYLRKEQDNYRDALPEFREAVKLDPDYLNAWKMISDMADSMRLPAAEREAIQLNFVRLDPLERHSQFDISKVVDLGAVWTALETASKLRPPKPGPLYPLAASTAEIKKHTKNADENPDALPDPGMDDSGDENKNPGNVVARNRFIQAVTEIYPYGEELLNGTLPSD